MFCTSQLCMLGVLAVCWLAPVAGVSLLVILKPVAQPSTISLFPPATATSTMCYTRCNLAKMALAGLTEVGALRHVLIVASSWVAAFVGFWCDSQELY